MNPIISIPWTAAEDALLRRHLSAGGTSAAAGITGRTAHAVRDRARRLGFVRQRNWNQIERRRLRNMWGAMGLVEIGEKLGRSPGAVYTEAYRLGLKRGVPDGMEGITHAARRTGFAVISLKRILKWAGVKVQRPISRPTSTGPRRGLCVDPFDVDEAVERYLKTETLEAAAQARGTTSERLSKLIALVPNAPPKPKKNQQWRIPTEVVDLAIAGERQAA